MECEQRLARKSGNTLFQVILLLWLIGQFGRGQLALAQWISHGPFGGHVKIIAIDPQTPSTLYAGTVGGGVFRSSNGGGNWTAVNSGLTNPYVDTNVGAIAIHPQTPSTLYAGTFSEGVYRSSNGGGNWTATNTGLMASQVSALAIDLQTPSTLYAGTGGGVFK